MSELRQNLATAEWVVIASSPYTLSNVPYFHWYVRITPRLIIPGGFKVGTKINVNRHYQKNLQNN